MSISPGPNRLDTIRHHRDNAVTRLVNVGSTAAVSGFLSVAKETLVDHLPLIGTAEQSSDVLKNAGIVAIEGALVSIAGQVLIESGFLRRHPMATAAGTVGGIVAAGTSYYFGMPTPYIIPTVIATATAAGAIAEKFIDTTKGFGNTIVKAVSKIIPGPASAVAVLKKPSNRRADRPVVAEVPRRKSREELEFERSQKTVVGIAETGANVFLTELDVINDLQVRVQQFERTPRALPKGTTKEGLEDQMVDHFFGVWAWYMKNRPFASGSEIDDADIEHVETNKVEILKAAIEGWGESQVDFDMHDLLQVLIENTNPADDFIDLTDFIPLDKLQYKDKAQIGLRVIRYTDSLAARIASERRRFADSEKTDRDEQRYMTVVRKAVIDWEVNLDKFFEQSPPDLHA